MEYILLMFFFRFNKLVSYLHHEGFRACRTPFEPEAIRTDATLKELVDIVLKNGPNSWHSCSLNKNEYIFVYNNQFLLYLYSQ